MDLILWRHADAQEADPVDDQQEMVRRDLARSLTGRGQKHAARMAVWLDHQMSDSTRILVSPALRCEQTALNLGRKFKICEQLAPDRSVDDLLQAAQWPDSKHPVLVVGHQPTLGRVAARLLGLPQLELSVRKGGVWWLRSRERDGQSQTVLLAVHSPDLR
ncbi:MAG: histidine phosphatase family protein [Betaproteobacteria bacterium]